MTMLAAKVFRMCLVDRLEAPFGGNVAAGVSAEVLARVFREGLPGLLRALDEEANDPNERDRVHVFSIFETLMAVWTSPGDDRHLEVATGKSRDEWLAAPLWTFAT